MLDVPHNDIDGEVRLGRQSEVQENQIERVDLP